MVVAGPYLETVVCYVLFNVHLIFEVGCTLICRKVMEWMNDPKTYFSNQYIFATLWLKHLVFKILTKWPNNIYILKYLRSSTTGCKDLGIRKLWFVINAHLFGNKEFMVNNENIASRPFTDFYFILHGFCVREVLLPL